MEIQGDPTKDCKDGLGVLKVSVEFDQAVFGKNEEPKA